MPDTDDYNPINILRFYGLGFSRKYTDDRVIDHIGLEQDYEMAKKLSDQTIQEMFRGRIAVVMSLLQDFGLAESDLQNKDTQLSALWRATTNLEITMAPVTLTQDKDKPREEQDICMFVTHKSNKEAEPTMLVETLKDFPSDSLVTKLMLLNG